MHYGCNILFLNTRTSLAKTSHIFLVHVLKVNVQTKIKDQSIRTCSESRKQIPQKIPHTMYHYTLPPNLTDSGYHLVSLLFHKKINYCRILMVNGEF